MFFFFKFVFQIFWCCWVQIAKTAKNSSLCTSQIHRASVCLCDPLLALQGHCDALPLKALGGVCGIGCSLATLQRPCGRSTAAPWWLCGCFMAVLKLRVLYSPSSVAMRLLYGSYVGFCACPHSLYGSSAAVPRRSYGFCTAVLWHAPRHILCPRVMCGPVPQVLQLFLCLRMLYGSFACGCSMAGLWRFCSCQETAIMGPPQTPQTPNTANPNRNWEVKRN